MRRVRTEPAIEAGDILAIVGGGVLGLAVGFIAGGSVGRVNSRRIAEAVSRWRRGRSRRAPKVWTENDAERLEARVLDALSADVILARRPVRVRVLGLGLVELSGRVSHIAEVALAGDIAQEIAGVDTVLNHLLVTGVDETVVAVSGPNTPRAARG